MNILDKNLTNIHIVSYGFRDPPLVSQILGSGSDITFQQPPCIFSFLVEVTN